MKKKRGQITKYFLQAMNRKRSAWGLKCIIFIMHFSPASTTMDTLKEILNDISTSCKDMSVGQTIM